MLLKKSGLKFQSGLSVTEAELQRLRRVQSEYCSKELSVRMYPRCDRAVRQH